MKKRWVTGLMGCSLISVLLGHGIMPVLAAATFTPQQPSFAAGQWPDRSQDLCFVADETLKYLAKGAAYDPAAIHGGNIAGAKVPLSRVETTLKYRG